MMDDFKNEMRNEIQNVLVGLRRNTESEDENEEAGEELEVEEAKGPIYEGEEIFLRVVVQVSKIHKVEVSNFSGSLNPKDLIDWIEDLENYFKFEDVKDQHRVQLAQTKLKGHATLW